MTLEPGDADDLDQQASVGLTSGSELSRDEARRSADRQAGYSLSAYEGDANSLV